MLALIALYAVIVYFVVLGLAYFAGHANLFFTIIKEGTAKTVVRSKRFHKALMAYLGHRLNSPWSIFFQPGEPEWEVLKKKDMPFRFGSLRVWRNVAVLIIGSPIFLILKSFEYFGIYFVGLIPGLYSVYVRDKWFWIEWEQKQDGTYELRPREEQTDFVFVNEFTYGFLLKGAEAAGGAPLDVKYAVTLRTTNPRKALHEGGDDWLNRATVLYHSQARQFVGTHEPESLLAMNFSAGTDEEKKSFQDTILRINNNLPGITTAPGEGGFKYLRGIEATDARIDSLDPSGTEEEKQEYRAIWLKRYTARESAEAVRIAAKGDADAARTKAQGDADATRTTADARGYAYDVVTGRGDKAMTLAALEAMTETGKTGKAILWANNPFGQIGTLIESLGKKE
jgi:regulator of protease activity HflC (stomatin/prohibitin superfamily)